MADLNPLIRVRRHVVEQKQKFLAELYRHADELAEQKQGLIEQMAAERVKMDEMDLEFQNYFGPYSAAVKGHIAAIDHSQSELEKRIELAREDMRAAFAELKKVEITQGRREDEELAEVKKKESAELDEIGLEVFRRAQDEG